MKEQLISILDQVWSNFRLTDAADIALVSLIVYSLLVWFKETASRRALVGLLVLIAVYLSARVFDMYLTSLVFHTGFAVLIIVLIVIFQDDLRRMLERIAGWGLARRFRPVQPGRSDLDTLVEAVFGLAAERCGALIVLKGNDPVERHLQGGIALRGELSIPLLYSLFDSNSAGHDGAVIIQNKRVEKFGVHLPISKNHTEISGRGTRHSAALGLSECCDALTVVVSEERGVVNVAEAGALQLIPSASALKTRIDAFLKAKVPPATRKPVWSRFVVRNWPLKATAIGLAVTAWFALAYDPSTVQRTFVTPVQYRNLPPDLVLDTTAVHEVRLTLSGSERNFRFLEPATLTVSVDLGDASAGSQTVGITDRDIRLPLNIELYSIEPRVLNLNLKRQQSAAVQ